jgi:hypothetical protein
MRLFLWNPVESSPIPVDSTGFQSHSGGFQWIPVESSHSCRNVRGIKKYCMIPLLADATTTAQ